MFERRHGEKRHVKVKGCVQVCVYLGARGAPALLAAILEADLFGFGDGCGFIKLHQLVERRELLGPQEVLALIVPHHLEVLNVILMSEAEHLSKFRNFRSVSVFKHIS